MKSLEERLNQVIPKLTSQDFLSNKGLGNEIGFWIFDYPPERELEVREFLDECIIPALEKRQPALKVAHINLFTFITGLLAERNLLDKAIQMQNLQGDDKALESLRRVLKEDKLAEMIANSIDHQATNMLILTGVGAAYPMLRTHTLLSALHPHMMDTPLVMFYPGNYDGHSFKLFNKLSEDHYYRAFRLVPHD